jgi:23S rRNA (pseudouridine1915-N3)-methyltransferase
MRLRVLAIGRRPDRDIGPLCDAYVKRSRTLLPIERITCRDVETAWAKTKAEPGPVVVLDERGEPLSSPELANWLQHCRDQGVRSIAFLIGDAHGFSDHDRSTADRVLALSRLTLPHRLAQLIVCEQLYRAGTILAGHPYHHA